MSQGFGTPPQTPGGDALSNLVNASTNTTAAAGDVVFVDTTSGPVTITLPTTPAALSQVVVKKVNDDSGASAVTVVAHGSGLIDRASDYVITDFNGSATFQNLAADTWKVISEVGPLSAQSGSGAVLPWMPTEPWATPAPIGPELAVVANLQGGYNTTLPIPTLTASSATLNSRTLIELGNLANQELSFRVKWTLAALPADGWASVRLRVVDAGGTMLAGTDEQIVAANGGYAKTGETFTFDFKAGSWAVGGTYLEVRLDVFNNATSGTLQISNLSVKQIAVPQRPILYTESHLGAPGYPQIFTPLYDPVSGTYRMALTEISDDGALDKALKGITGYNTDRPFRYDPPDPDFAATSLGSTGDAWKPEILLATGEVSASLRVNNNDQILEVLKQDGTTWELRGNTHGGETLRSTSSPNLIYELDKGDGAWVTWNGLGKGLRTTRRLRWTWNTKIARSAPDSDDIANVDHVSTFFQDGMMRLDRTTTFLKAVRLRSMFEWMSSHDTSVGAIGRIGAGSQVLDEVDVYPKLAAPAAPTTATATSGGSLAAGTYMYAITALTEDGETTRSGTVTQATTGSASTVTLTLPAAATGQTGWRVYGRANNVSRLVLLATLVASATSWVDTGAVPAFGSFPPNVNTARRLDSASIATDWAISDAATWAVWYDQATNLCMGNMYDRDALITRAGVAGVKMRLGGTASSIRKNYLTVHWTGDGSPSYPDGETALIASGTVWTETHYAFTYCPADPVNYHREIALRAADLTLLASLYPAT